MISRTKRWFGLLIYEWVVRYLVHLSKLDYDYIVDYTILLRRGKNAHEPVHYKFTYGVRHRA